MNKSQFLEWKQNPVTIEVFRQLKQTQQLFQDSLQNGSTVDVASVEATALNTTKILGVLEGLSYSLNVNFHEDDVEEGEFTE